jgi:hypothetical protein
MLWDMVPSNYLNEVFDSTGKMVSLLVASNAYFIALSMFMFVKLGE